MKILITGSAGFIGSHLTTSLVKELDNEIQIYTIDNLWRGNENALYRGRLISLGIDPDNDFKDHFIQSSEYDNLFFRQIDLANTNSLRSIFQEHRFNCVINLAALAGVRNSIKHQEKYTLSNVLGFNNLMEHAVKTGVKLVLFASSSSVYGNSKVSPFNESFDTSYPISIYAGTKKANEVFAHFYAKNYNLAVIGLRFFTVYGPWGREDMAPFIFTDAIAKGKPINLFNHGQMIRDFTFISDIVQGIGLIIKAHIKSPIQPGFDIYNIGNGRAEFLSDFVEAIEQQLGKKAQVVYKEIQPGDVQSTLSDISKMREHFGYNPKVNLQEGMMHYVNWYKSFYGLES